MKAYSLEVLVIDFDRIGGNSVREELENGRFANRCISPTVKKITEVEIGEWHDGHPLNKHNTATAEYLRLFSKSQAEAQPITSNPSLSSQVDLNKLEFVPDAQYSVTDMANVGYGLIQAIQSYRPRYVWNQAPSEIVGDLVNEVQESRRAASLALELAGVLLMEKNPTLTKKPADLEGTENMSLAASEHEVIVNFLAATFAGAGRAFQGPEARQMCGQMATILQQQLASIR